MRSSVRDDKKGNLSFIAGSALNSSSTLGDVGLKAGRTSSVKVVDEVWLDFMEPTAENITVGDTNLTRGRSGKR